MIVGLETARLILKPLELADASHTQRLFAHWEVLRFLTEKVPWPYPEDGALSYYRDIALPAIARGDEWHSSIRLKTDPHELIGCASLSKGEEENRGFWLGLSWQNQGFMSEVADVITDFWFNELGFSVMRVSKAVANTASRRISAKNGMRIVAVDERNYVAGRFAAEVRETTAEEWQIHRAQTRGTNHFGRAAAAKLLI